MSRSTDEESRRATTDVPPEREQGPYVLTIHGPDRGVRTFLLIAGQRYTVGRHRAADIVLAHSWVSERHAVITAADPPYIVDAGSRNGTFVDGQRLSSQEPRELAVGSVISVGGFSLLVTRGDELTSGVLPRAPRVPQAPTVAQRSETEEQTVRIGPAAPVVRDARMQALYALARQIAPSSVSVLITGETGAGKELMAQAIHQGGSRGRRPLVSLNCAAIPESLVESELFGYERGAFSGAVTTKRGLFEHADGSTFFLDEIGELPANVQAKLLRVLETGEVLRLGGVKPIRVDVRIVAATNREIAAQVRAGTFRADLYYRLNGVTISIPPLRERPDDVEELARHFAARASGPRPIRFTEAALRALAAHRFPGNVRELKSVIERAVLVCSEGVIDQGDLGLEIVPEVEERAAPAPDPAEEVTETFTTAELSTEVVRAELLRRERRHTLDALERTGGNQTEAARLLGISRRTLMNRMDRFGINRPRKGGGRSDE